MKRSLSEASTDDLTQTHPVAGAHFLETSNKRRKTGSSTKHPSFVEFSLSLSLSDDSQCAADLPFVDSESDRALLQDTSTYKEVSQLPTDDIRNFGGALPGDSPETSSDSTGAGIHLNSESISTSIEGKLQKQRSTDSSLASASSWKTPKSKSSSLSRHLRLSQNRSGDGQKKTGSKVKRVSFIHALASSSSLPTEAVKGTMDGDVSELRPMCPQTLTIEYSDEEMADEKQIDTNSMATELSAFPSDNLLKFECRECHRYSLTRDVSKYEKTRALPMSTDVPTTVELSVTHVLFPAPCAHSSDTDDEENLELRRMLFGSVAKKTVAERSGANGELQISLTVGRDEDACDIVMESTKRGEEVGCFISKVQCKLIYALVSGSAEFGWHLLDDCSTNGVHVNNVRCARGERQPLANGDIVLFGARSRRSEYRYTFNRLGAVQLNRTEVATAVRQRRKSRRKRRDSLRELAETQRAAERKTEAAAIALKKQQLDEMIRRNKEQMQKDLLERNRREKERMEKETAEGKAKEAEEKRRKEEESERERKKEELEREGERQRQAKDALMAQKRKHLEALATRDRELEAQKKRVAEMEAKSQAANDQLAQNFDCIFCLDLMCAPTSLQCGHTACHQCIYAFLQSTAGGSEVQRNCPTCRKRIAADYQLVVVHSMKCIIREFVAKADAETKKEFAERESEYKDWFAALEFQQKMEEESKNEATQMAAGRMAAVYSSTSASVSSTEITVPRPMTGRRPMQSMNAEEYTRQRVAMLRKVSTQIQPMNRKFQTLHQKVTQFYAQLSQLNQMAQMNPTNVALKQQLATFSFEYQKQFEEMNIVGRSVQSLQQQMQAISSDLKRRGVGIQTVTSASMHATGVQRRDPQTFPEYEKYFESDARSKYTQWAQCSRCKKWRVHYVAKEQFQAQFGEKQSAWSPPKGWHCGQCVNPKNGGIVGSNGCKQPQETPNTRTYDSVELNALKYQRAKQVHMHEANQ